MLFTRDLLRLVQIWSLQGMQLNMEHLAPSISHFWNLVDMLRFDPLLLTYFSSVWAKSAKAWMQSGLIQQ